MASSESNFKLPSISTLAGASIRVYFKALWGRRIEAAYFIKVLITFLIILFATPFRWLDYLYFYNLRRKNIIRENPLFILGHWRSGTTFLHNVLCQDPKAAYITTYQSLFPEHLMSQWLFKTFMRTVMPKKRPSDNVELSVNFPQEDEFAMGNMISYCYYYFFHFPFDWPEYYRKYIGFEEHEKVSRRWKAAYHRLISKAILHTGGTRAIFKNPVNTGRVKTLLEMFPEAKFIFIYRNPVVVYLSTKKFFIKLFPTLQFQKISEEQICDLIFEVYQKLMEDYFRDKALIPAENLIEICFEDFEEKPLEHLEKIYQTLHLSNFKEAQPYLEDYVRSQETYEKNRYKISQKELDRVLSHWKFTMETWQYEVPQNLEVL